MKRCLQMYVKARSTFTSRSQASYVNVVAGTYRGGEIIKSDIS